MSLKVERLSIYPIKSCARLDVTEFQIGSSGPQVPVGEHCVGDREWMFVDSDGKFLTQRTLPKMALLQPVIQGHQFFLSFDGKEFEIPLGPSSIRMNVSVWGKEVDAARVEGPLNQAASEFLKKPVQLVHFDDLSDREALVKGRGLGVQTRFTDSQPYLVVTVESLRDLNSKMQDAIGDDHFRANILLSGATAAFEEDNWQYLGNDQIVFETTKPCARCKIITVDPQKGVIPNSEPLVALAKYRKRETAVYFGQYFLSRSFGEVLSVGARFKSHHNAG